MVDTVLAGPDGRTPAVDQITGAPLTMEMMMRRRGILTTPGGRFDYGGQQEQQTASTGSVQPVAGNATAASSPQAASVVTGAAGTGPPFPAAPSSMQAATGDGSTGAPDETAVFDALIAAGMTSVAARALMQGWDKRLLGARNGTPQPSTPTNGATATPPQQGSAVARVRTQQRGSGRSQGQLPSFGADDISDADYRVIGDDPALGAPQRRLSGPNAQPQLPATARALGARNNPGANVPMVREPDAIGIPANDPDGMSGVLRTLGLPPEAVDKLARNPGLLDTLRRVRPR